MSRHDFYAPVHKGIRFALSNLLVTLAQTDFEDEAQASAAAAALRRQMTLSEKHLHHEDLVIHAALEARVPGSTAGLDADHGHHRAAFAAIERLIQAVESAPTAERRARGRDLYLRFTQFVADDLAHMAEEETVTLPLLHSAFTDEELVAMEARIVAMLPPEHAIAFMQLMIPAMSRAERLAFLAFTRGAAPPEAFDAILNFAARPALAPADYAHLAEGLGLAA